MGRPEPPDTPHCIQCGHTSMHSVGPLGMCYVNSCGCLEPKWADTKLTARWKRYHAKYDKWLAESNREWTISRFREIAGPIEISDEKIVEIAGALER